MIIHVQRVYVVISVSRPRNLTYNPNLQDPNPRRVHIQTTIRDNLRGPYRPEHL